MKIYCGTDIANVSRIKEAIEKNKYFVNRIFSENEIADIEKCKNEELKYQRYAGRFAAKEAIYKAISKITIDENIFPSFLDVEILNDDEYKRRPYVNITGDMLKKVFQKYDAKIDVSISHEKDSVVAMAIMYIDKE